jgi:periplasmic protein TonB
MKKNSPLLMLVFAFALLQSCGPKAEENSDATEMEATSEANVQEDRMAKREKIEAARTEMLEQRRLAAIEKANASLTYKDASGKVIYNKAEVDPTYMGGDKEMMAYLRDNLTYPEIAQKNGVEGTVFVDFIVDQKGAIREVVATDVTNDEMDQSLTAEAIRVVTAMPNWVAGTQHGKAVNANYSVPITFQLSN